jgi:anti-anti-sigma regulatory factor
MSLIYIKESTSEDNMAIIRVDGELDIASVPVLEEVCRRHLDRDRKVHLNIGGLYHISREGKDFLMRVRDKVTLEEIPGYIRLGG